MGKRAMPEIRDVFTKEHLESLISLGYKIIAKQKIHIDDQVIEGWILKYSPNCKPKNKF